MDFEKAYKKFLDGTATPEEIEFVRGEMKKANEVNDILSNVKKEGATEVAEKEQVQKAIKTYRKRDTLKILIIVACSVLLLAIVTSCAIGLPILSNAKKNVNYTESDAREIAVEYLEERFPKGKGKIKVERVEKELEVEGRIKKAHYVYVLDVYNGVNEVWEIEVDSRTGRIIDADD